jgi:hypothetical protein
MRAVVQCLCAMQVPRKGDGISLALEGQVTLPRRAVNEKRGTTMTRWLANRYGQESGAIGYILLWALGVPASVLFVIFLLRGCN